MLNTLVSTQVKNNNNIVFVLHSFLYLSNHFVFKLERVVMFVLFSDLQQQPSQQMNLKTVTNRSQEHISIFNLLLSWVLGVVYGNEININSAHKSNLSLIPSLTFSGLFMSEFVCLQTPNRETSLSDWTEIAAKSDKKALKQMFSIKPYIFRATNI